MATTTVLRPSATSSGVGWTATPSGTLNGVTSDDSDVTYALWSGSGSALILPTPADAPPAGERRHQVRLRMRGEDGNAWGAVRLASGALVAGAAAAFTASPGTVNGAWGFGAPADGSTVLSAYVTGQSLGVKIEELYIDVDTRLAPTFTPQVLDSTGTSTTTITDTAQPSLLASSPNLDGLSARQYRYWVTLAGVIVWDTGVVSGPSQPVQTDALDNGAYVAHLQIWSTLGQNTAYASDEETVVFTVTVGVVPPPDNPIVTAVDGTPLYNLQVCAPYAGDFDDDQAYIEIQRVDCPQGGYLLLTGATDGFASTDNPGPALTNLQVTFHGERSDAWIPSANETMVSHYLTTGNQRSWRLQLNADTGQPELNWSVTGSSTLTTATATDGPVIDGFNRAWVRATLTVNDGAGGWSVLFETQNEGEWVPLGDIITNSGAGTTSLFASTADYLVGAYAGSSSSLNEWTGRVYSVSVRDGAAGADILSPDFTGRPAGTSSFTDEEANVWTVNSPASITSDQKLTTVAILGPLATDECASYTDFSHPRTGLGATCDHGAADCCSYYRARTLGRIDGQLQISNWSNTFNSGIPLGMIAMWPGTAASLPSGWRRTTALDAKYPKGVATSATQPGATGGAATHTHTVPTHTHSASHTHTVTGSSGAATGTTPGNDGATGTTAILSSHTHTVPTTGSASVTVSGTATPAIGTDNNDPANLAVIFMESDGTPLGVPGSALAFMPDIAPTGWTDYANATSRFLKGAAAAGDGGATAASALDAHTHSIGAHSHTGATHQHSSTAQTITSNKTLFAGATQALWTASHSHPVTAASTAAASLATNAAGSSGASAGSGALEPPFRNVRVRQNGNGAPDLPVGIVCAWRGSLGSIPNFWQLCDGTNGTLDMTGVYPKGATSSIGTTGGTLSPHSHTSPSHSDHTTSGHTHTQSLGSAAAVTAAISNVNTVTVALGTHTHTAPNTNSTTPTVGSSTSGTLANTTQEPPYEEVAFVQLMATPTPPPDPEETCLTWDEDYHLIRSQDASGPLWAQVGGIITWDRDRPFNSATGVMGKRFITSAPPGGRNFHMTAAVSSEAELAQLQTVLNRPLVLVSPSDSTEMWAAPVASSVKVVKIGRIRQVTADFIGTGPQPSPQLADVGV